MMPCDKLETFHLNLYRTYEHETWQSDDLGRGAHPCPLDHVVT